MQAYISPFGLYRRLRHLIGDRDGTVAILFGFLAIPLMVTAGMGIDYAQAQHIRNLLQGAVDQAALAGASAYKTTADQQNASTIATTYMNNALTTLPLKSGITFTVTPGTASSGGNTVGYTVAINASAAVPTTIMRLANIDSMPVSVTATAENPVTTASIDLTGFYSSACDGNTIYWYLIPPGSNASTYVPTSRDLTELWTNTVSNPPPPAPFTLPSSSQQIGFALHNVTGERCNYGPNQYGGQPGTSHWAYSNLYPPAKKAYPGVSGNRSLQVVPMPQGQTLPQVLNNLPRQIFNHNFADAAPTCGELNGQTMVYAWNDMGGGSDDLDYNDAAYTFTCSGADSNAGGGASGVVLIH